MVQDKVNDVFRDVFHLSYTKNRFCLRAFLAETFLTVCSVERLGVASMLLLIDSISDSSIHCLYGFHFMHYNLNGFIITSWIWTIFVHILGTEVCYEKTVYSCLGATVSGEVVPRVERKAFLSTREWWQIQLLQFKSGIPIYMV